MISVKDLGKGYRTVHDLIMHNFREVHKDHLKARALRMRRGRVFQRLITGVKVHRAAGRRIRFITLTSSDQSPVGDLNKNFNILVKRIRRRYGVFEYCKVKTTEGNGVLHMMAVGKFMAFKWLQEQWKQIHKAFIVNIKEVQRKGDYRLAGYLIPYIGHHDQTRLSYSWGWLWKGFHLTWRRVKSKNFVDMIRHNYWVDLTARNKNRFYYKKKDRHWDFPSGVDPKKYTFREMMHRSVTNICNSATSYGLSFDYYISQTETPLRGR